MSEAILYALDAPLVTDAKAAADFVDQHSDGADEPTPKIAAFFDALLHTWPEDGTNGEVWYEDFTHNKPAGNILAMTFDLSAFDEGTLRTLRTLAEQYGLHVLDPEGEVLYLADGSEASIYG